MLKKTIRVVAALIRKDDCIFAAERAYGFLKGKWEFPGGKIEDGETPEQAIVREIKEELDTDIRPVSFFTNVKHEYEEFYLDMDVFECEVLSGRLDIRNGIHTAEAWVPISDLQEERWCPADQKIVALIKNHD